MSEMHRLWTTDFDDLPKTDNDALSLDDRRAAAMMRSSIRQLPDGHFEIGLPWKDDIDLPCNKAHAAVRLGHVRKRLERDPKLHAMYKEQVEEYISQGYARVADSEPTNSTQKRTWYLPHHPVFNEKKPDKVRVVFDGAARFKGTSVNDHLLQGPDLTNNLAGVLMRFRLEPKALIADITAMFHQVKVPPQDQEALRFLWWTDGDLTQPPQDYVMTRHVFGLRSSPSCAAFALQETARQHKLKYPARIGEYVRRNFYVDDLLLSVPTEAEAVQAIEGLHGLLARGGFQLVKWTTNDRSVLERIPPDLRAQTVRHLDTKLDAMPCTKMLGQSWAPDEDAFK
jgi:hypothetical protein